MPRFYEQDELAKVQATELEILRDFMQICDDNGLSYFGVAGTGIGAIRHGGFIPWDDDIDIAMPRKDFERMIELVEEKLGDKYYILNTEHNKNYPLMTTRMCKRGTKFVEKPLMNIDCDFGIFLDLYPFDNYPDNELLFCIQKWRAWFYSKLLILRSIPEPVLAQTGNLKTAITLVCKAVHNIMDFLRIDKMFLYNRCKKICTMYNDKETKRFGYPCDTSPDYNKLYKKKVFPLRKWKFEDVELNFPKDMKGMLRNFFGDTYMTLPPEEKRKTHFPYILDFGDGERRTER